MLRLLRVAPILVVILVIVGSAGVASAEDSWTETVAFTRGDASAIKVFEPDGYTAAVTVGGETQSDAVPTVLRVPNSDAFVVVTITAPNGAKWSKKIETKKNHVTELRVKHIAAVAKAPGGAKKFFGKFVSSTKLPCRVDSSKTKIEFVGGDGTSVASFLMTENKSFTGEVPEGDYSVRTFRVDPDGTSTYRNTRNASIKADGWVATIFCDPKTGVDISVSAK